MVRQGMMTSQRRSIDRAGRSLLLATRYRPLEFLTLSGGFYNNMNALFCGWAAKYFGQLLERIKGFLLVQLEYPLLYSILYFFRSPLDIHLIQQEVIDINVGECVRFLFLDCLLQLAD
jgi:hypothetical protein